MTNRMSAFSSFSQVLQDIWQVLGFRYALFLFLVTVTGLMEGISLASVVPLLSLISVDGRAGGKEISNGQESLLSNLAVDLLNKVGLDPTFESILIFIMLALSVSTMLYLLQSYIGARLQTGYVFTWQTRLASLMFRAHWSFFVNHRQSDLVNALITEVPRLGGAFYQAGLLIVGIIHTVIYLGVATSLSGATSLIVVLGGGLLFLLSRPLILRAYKIGHGIAFDNAEFQSIASEMVHSAKSLKVTATEPQAISMLKEVTGRLKQHTFKNAFDIQLAKGIFDFGAAALVASVLYASHKFLQVELATTLVILAIFVRLMPKLTGFQQSLQSISVTAPTLDTLTQLVGGLSSAQEHENRSPLPKSLHQGPFRINFQDISISYGKNDIIDRLNLTIAAGETVALVGASGAGKTSLVDAVLALVPVTSGAILLNDVPLSQLPITSLRQRVGYMGQESVIYNTTIRRNVLWNHADQDEKKYQEALERAAAKAFVDRLPMGGETYIGNAGATLSGGEKQRLALARALLGSPGLLILDEATSALDAEAEAVVSAALQQQKGKVTILLIAHRLSSAKIADRICVLDKGKLVESGRWDELYARENGAFRRLYELQLGG